ncbi:MAG: cell wall hydrolase [Peptococcaceae bacterium]|nr:cell wall hydrolase [Peptococcaceae bacterium]
MRKKISMLLFAALLLCPFAMTQQADAESGTYSNSDVMVLAKMIHGEARGEPYVGKVAVGAVILNRVEDKKFPDSVHGVCFQPGAFDAVSDGQYYMEPDKEALKAAKAALNGWDPTYGALYYWNPATATSKWIWSRKVITQIGKHIFGV